MADTKLSALTAVLGSAIVDADIFYAVVSGTLVSYKITRAELHAALVSGYFATQAQAEAGTNDTQLMTPLHTAQAIAALGGADHAWEFVEDTYDSATDTTAGSVESAAFADGFEYAFAIFGVLGTNSTATWQMQLYGATALAYATAVNISPAKANAADDLIGWVELKLPRTTSNVSFIHALVNEDSNISGNDTADISGSSNVVHWATAQKISKVKFKPSSGTFDSAGTIAMYRRPVT